MEPARYTLNQTSPPGAQTVSPEVLAGRREVLGGTYSPAGLCFLSFVQQQLSLALFGIHVQGAARERPVDFVLALISLGGSESGVPSKMTTSCKPQRQIS